MAMNVHYQWFGNFIPYVVYLHHTWFTSITPVTSRNIIGARDFGFKVLLHDKEDFSYMRFTSNFSHFSPMWLTFIARVTLTSNFSHFSHMWFTFIARVTFLDGARDSGFNVLLHKYICLRILGNLIIESCFIQWCIFNKLGPSSILEKWSTTILTKLILLIFMRTLRSLVSLWQVWYRSLCWLCKFDNDFPCGV